MKYCTSYNSVLQKWKCVWWLQWTYQRVAYLLIALHNPRVLSLLVCTVEASDPNTVFQSRWWRGAWLRNVIVDTRSENCSAVLCLGSDEDEAVLWWTVALLGFLDLLPRPAALMVPYRLPVEHCFSATQSQPQTLMVFMHSFTFVSCSRAHWV